MINNIHSIIISRQNTVFSWAGTWTLDLLLFVHHVDPQVTENFCSIWIPYLQSQQLSQLSSSLIYWLIDWLIGILFLAGPGFWKWILLQCSITMLSTCSLLSWCKISSSFMKNNNVTVFQFPFTHLHAVGQRVVHPPSRIISHPKIMSWSLLAHPPSERILIPGFAIYDIVHSPPLGDIDRMFFLLRWGWDPKAFLVPLWYVLKAFAFAGHKFANSVIVITL